jgi:hypothetical protein
MSLQKLSRYSPLRLTTPYQPMLQDLFQKRLVILSQSATTRQCRTNTTTASSSLRPRRLQRVRKGKSNISQGHEFGMKPIDYSFPPPVAPILIPPPPPGGIRGLISPALMLIFFGSSIYLYFNADDDIVDYWTRVESGGLLMDDDDDEEEEDAAVAVLRLGLPALPLPE